MNKSMCRAAPNNAQKTNKIYSDRATHKFIRIIERATSEKR